MTALAVAAAATFTGMAVLGLAACAHPVPGSAVVATTSVAGTPPPTTEAAPPPVTVYVAPPVTVTEPVPAPPKPAQTSCQWLKANGYSYAYAVELWVDAGLPANWDADRDGYPCEQSYGNQN